VFILSAKTNELGTPLASLKQRLFFDASFIHTPGGNFSKANHFLSAKDLSAEGSINEVQSAVKQFHQVKLPSSVAFISRVATPSSIKHPGSRIFQWN